MLLSTFQSLSTIQFHRYGEKNRMNICFIKFSITMGGYTKVSISNLDRSIIMNLNVTYFIAGWMVSNWYTTHPTMMYLTLYKLFYCDECYISIVLRRKGKQLLKGTGIIYIPHNNNRISILSVCVCAPFMFFMQIFTLMKNITNYIWLEAGVQGGCYKL